MVFSRLLLPFLAGALGYYMGRDSGRASQRALPPASTHVPMLEIGPDCSSWSVIDPTRVELTTRFVYARERLRNVTDPLVIANALAKEIAPTCRRYGQAPPRNPGEYDLYVTIAASVIDEMVADNTLSPEAKVAAQQQVEAWAASTAGA